jgi:hypothetical protein
VLYSEAYVDRTTPDGLFPGEWAFEIEQNVKTARRIGIDWADQVLVPRGHITLTGSNPLTTVVFFNQMVVLVESHERTLRDAGALGDRVLALTTRKTRKRHSAEPPDEQVFKEVGQRQQERNVPSQRAGRQEMGCPRMGRYSTTVTSNFPRQRYRRPLQTNVRRASVYGRRGTNTNIAG